MTHSTEKKAEAAKEAGNKLLSAKEYRGAIDQYTNAIKLNPLNVVYWSNRAQAYINLKEWDNAIKDALKAIRVDTKYYKAHYRLGVAYQGLNRHPEAVAAFEAALKAAGSGADTDSIRELLAISKQRLGGGGGGAGGAGGAGGFDFASLMSNPAIAGLMNNPAMAGLMNNPALAGMMGGGGGGGGGRGGAGGAGGSGGMPDFAALMRDPNIMNMAQGLMANPNMANLMSGMMGGAAAGAGGSGSGSGSGSGAAASTGAGAGGGDGDLYRKLMAIPAVAALKDDVRTSISVVCGLRLTRFLWCCVLRVMM